MSTQIIAAIIIYLLIMVMIGWYGYKKTASHSDYTLGGRGLSPTVAALSAGASDMSGWLMLALPGSMYLTGLGAGWLALGLIIGAYLNWVFLAPRLRTYTETANDSITIPSFLENRFIDSTKLLRILSGIIIIFFFTIYVSSGMVSGGRVFDSLLGIDYHTSLLIVAGVTILYTLFGGFLAVSWTDVVQGGVMMLALLIVPIFALAEVGGVSSSFDQIRSIDPQLLDIFRGVTVITIIGSLAWGLGYFGQPHIIVRFMALRTAKEAKPARRIGMAWMIISIIGAMFTGLVGRAYLSNEGVFLNPDNDSQHETVFVVLGEMLFHPFVIGIIFSAILAAVMSTISSQLLVTSSSLTEDLYKTFLKRKPGDRELVFLGRAAVLVVALIALALSWNPDSSILELVSYAWAGFGAAFGPVMLISLYWKGMTRWGALAGMLSGAIVVIVWANTSLYQVFGMNERVYELLPGFIVATIMIFVVSKLTKNDERVALGFKEFKKQLQANK
ncbi:sodium/proline symporter PutP [Shouchella sp. JSM 1781072]|uniref:sodium/proline symporter PutP n=1 Tax=Bacillaceae TaxID=186817 RepID=UPI000C0782D3|nr:MULTISPECIES: sodium/proline symporter PutP [Bacillaceae]UTR08150.1 sodium/proline symporter PutP [Alkalihalobacillus sp. LMS6]